MAVSCHQAPVPEDRLWFLRLSDEEARAFRTAYRLIEGAERNFRACVELRKEPGFHLEVSEVHRKQALRGAPER